MCAGSAQVTFVEFRRSYYTGRNPEGETTTKQPKQHQARTPNTKATQNQTTKPPKEGSDLLRNSCGHVSLKRRGETGALNSAKLSVLLAPQQSA